MSMAINSSRDSYPVIRRRASLKSRNRPCGVEMKTPSCTLATRLRYFSSARLRSVMSFNTCTVPSWRPLGSVKVELDEPLIAAENPSQKIVDQDGVANGVEGVLPLVLCIRDLLEQTHIL